MNQPVELTGYIGSIDDSMFDEKNISITITGGEYSFSSVSCSKPRSAPEARELHKGIHVAVRGVVTSEEMGVMLSRCKFWSFSQNRWARGDQRAAEQRCQMQQTTISQSQQQSFKTYEEKSLNRNNKTGIEQGKARFYSSTMKETRDIGVELTYRREKQTYDSRSSMGRRI